MLALRVSRLSPLTGPSKLFRTLSTLSNNPHIVHPHLHPPNPKLTRPQYTHLDPSSQTYILSLLPTTPPTRSLAIGTTNALPPTSTSFTENPHFLSILQSVLRHHAAYDPDVKAQALVYASTAGVNLGSGGVFFPQTHQRNKRERSARSYGGGGGAGGDGAGGASAQGGMGGAGRAGWVHVSDTRNPPDYGRIAWPEDIFGSLEVDGRGEFVGEDGNYQDSGTYRVLTREGM